MKRSPASAEAERLGRAITARRAALGMKRRDLAWAAGLSYAYLAELENGYKRPSARRLDDLSTALRWTAADLLAYAGTLPGVDSPGDDELVALIVARLVEQLPALVRLELDRFRAARP